MLKRTGSVLNKTAASFSNKKNSLNLLKYYWFLYYNIIYCATHKLLMLLCSNANTDIYERMIWHSIFVTSPHLLFLILCCLLHLLFTPPYSPPHFLPLQRGGHMLQTCSVPSGWLPVILTPGESGSAGYKHREPPPFPPPPHPPPGPHTPEQKGWEKKHTHTGRKTEGEEKRADKTKNKAKKNNISRYSRRNKKFKNLRRLHGQKNSVQLWRKVTNQVAFQSHVV